MHNYEFDTKECINAKSIHIIFILFYKIKKKKEISCFFLFSLSNKNVFVDLSGHRVHAWRGVTAGAPITGPIVGTLGISMETFNSSYILLSIECIYSNA